MLQLILVNKTVSEQAKSPLVCKCKRAWKLAGQLYDQQHNAVFSPLLHVLIESVGVCVTQDLCQEVHPVARK